MREAAVQLINRSGGTTIVADSGSDNVNGEVDQLLRDKELTRVLAQNEVTYSNSMIEAFFRSLKHAWLYLHTLDSFSALARLVEFYVAAHNEVMPHSAFEGQTPDEMYFGTGGGVPAELTAAREIAREERMKANRSSGCSVCVPEADSKALQLRRPRSRMP